MEDRQDVIRRLDHPGYTGNAIHDFHILQILFLSQTVKMDIRFKLLNYVRFKATQSLSF